MVALEAALQFEDTRESMHAFCVGQYLEVRLGRGPLAGQEGGARVRETEVKARGLMRGLHALL